MEDEWIPLSEDQSHAARMRRTLLRKIAEQKVLGVCFLLRNRLTEQDRRNVIEFTDANEHWLAFEQLVLAMLNEGRSLSGYEYAVIESLYCYFGGAHMQVDDATMAQLKELIRT
jgi:hypothetical protein